MNEKFKGEIPPEVLETEPTNKIATASESDIRTVEVKYIAPVSVFESRWGKTEGQTLAEKEEELVALESSVAEMKESFRLGELQVGVNDDLRRAYNKLGNEKRIEIVDTMSKGFEDRLSDSAADQTERYISLLKKEIESEKNPQ